MKVYIHHQGQWLLPRTFSTVKVAAAVIMTVKSKNFEISNFFPVMMAAALL